MYVGNRLWLAALLWSLTAAPSFAETATLFRVFLKDGTAVVSYGEYAKVGDRLIFSMPIGQSLHVVNLPAASVNWDATERYSASARYHHYLKTRAEADYAALAGDIANALNAIVKTTDPTGRLALAVEARQRLASWPRDHYGYRAEDVREMLSLLDEAISGLRAAAGETSFAIDLVAVSSPPSTAHPPLLRDPSHAESISHAIAAVGASDVGSDRLSILRSVMAALENPLNALPKDWVQEMRRWARYMIGEETRVERAYADLAAKTLERAGDAAAEADVRRIENLIEEVARQDARLGRKRPQEIQGLIAEIGIQLDAARRLRLERDRWAEREGAFRAYLSAVRPVLSGTERAQRTLDDIKRLAGSDAGELVTMSDRFGDFRRTLASLAVPDELKPAHALLESAVHLAESAVRTRRQAVVSGVLQQAWDASSAAAGSMMLFARAQEDLETASRLPDLR